MKYARLLVPQSRRGEGRSLLLASYVLLIAVYAVRGVLPDAMWIDLPLHVAQVVVGSVLIVVAPGHFLYRLFDGESRRTSTCALLVGSLSIVCWALVFVLLYLVSLLTGGPVLTETVMLGVLGALLVGFQYLVTVREETTTNRLRQWSALSLSTPVGIALAALAVSVAGTHLRTAGIAVGSDVLLLALCLIAIIPLALWLDDPNEETAVVTIYLAAVALIFHMALISDYLWGWDVNQTFYLVSHLIETGAWDPDFFHRRTPLVSALAIPVTLRQVLGLDLNWIFKIYVPLLYALIPVGVYSLSRLYLSPRLSTLPPFVLMFYQRFFNTIQIKQHFGALFLVSLIIVLLSDELDRPQTLLVLLCFGLVTSHYVGAFLFVGMVGLYLVAAPVLDSLSLPSVKRGSITFSFVALAGVLFAFWYMSVAQGYIFRQFVEIPATIIVERLTATAEPVQERTGQSLITQTLQMGTIRMAYFIVFSSVFGLLATGTFVSVIRYFKRELPAPNRDHLLFCVPVFGMFTASIFIYGHFGIDRAIPFMFILAAPFVLVGASALGRFVSQPFGWSVDLAPAVAVLLAAFLLFNAGGIHYALGVNGAIEPSPSPQSFALEPEKNWAVFNDQETSGALWYVNHSDETHLTFAGNFGYISLQRYQNRYTTETSKYYTRYSNLTEADLYIRNLNSDICVEMNLNDECLKNPATGHKVYENGRSKVYQKGS